MNSAVGEETSFIEKEKKEQAVTEI